MKKILIHAWPLNNINGEYFIPSTNVRYLNEIIKYYDRIDLISAVITIDTYNNGFTSLTNFPTVSIIELPPSVSYVSAIKHFFTYINVYRKLGKYETIYSRYPVPFGWMQKLFFKDTKRIIHFVGDPVDATKNNPNLSSIKKTILTTFFKPEHAMYIWACKGAKVYTNGYHLAERLNMQGIKAFPVISSTITEDDFFLEENKSINDNAPKLLYIGYLRKAKGVETVINAFALLKLKYNNASLTIVGTGEFEIELKKIVLDLKIENIIFLGHVDNRNSLNTIIREHDIFCFASLSEGSPRVILEAMANGINIVSTPVGSLPLVFDNNKNILFAHFNDSEMFCEQILKLVENKKMAFDLRLNAYNKVKDFTINSFIKTVFCGE